MSFTIYKLCLFILIFSFSFFFNLCPTWSQVNEATFLATKGDVRTLFEKKSKEKQNLFPQAHYEGKNYFWTKAKIGQKIKARDIVQTGPDGHAKIVYKNGDQLSIGPGSSLSLPEATENQKNQPSKIDLYYGKMRALISKSGPRNQMEVKTQAATAGVRGTDFFVSESATQGFQVTVLRGAVALQSHSKNNERENKNPLSFKNEIMVRSGFSGNITPILTTEKTIEPNGTPQKQPTESAPPPHLAIKAATKEQLLQVQSITNIQIEKKELDSLPLETKNELEKLNKKTLSSVIADIKQENPKLLKDVDIQHVQSIDQLNKSIVAQLYNKAPSEEPKKKPTQDEMNIFGEDIYKKYFEKNEK
ncbi:MAG: FecR domain-containing protein [Bdellovibrionales bacterium]|nr:FecR domain-containing protein [Bdellovibrionales bacterium]